MNLRPTDTQTPEQPLHDAGFTLVELLIVMSVILILITLALPGYEKMHKKADQTSAMNSVRMINQMQGEYNSTYPAHGYASSIAQLGGKAGSGAATFEAAQLIPEDLATGFKSGYQFSITAASKNTVNNIDQYNAYTITAVPINVGKSGDLGYCSDETNQIRVDPKGGTNCTELLQ